MIQEVFEAFLTEYEIQKCLGFCEEEIDGYSGFVFTTAYHTVYSAAAVNNAIHRATKAYNDKEEKEAKKDGREPLLLPDFSAHHLRHTFCTRLCTTALTIKEIQDMSQRLDTAILLSKGVSYQKITEQVAVSSTTIGRVSKCLNYGAGGYQKAIERLAESEEL